VSEEGTAEAPSRKKCKKRKLPEPGQECDEVGDTAIGASKPVESCGDEVVSEEVSTKAPAAKGHGKYVAPHLRGRSGNESEEYTKIRRHVRGMKSVLFCLTRLFLPLMLNFYLSLNFLSLTCSRSSE